MIFEDELRKIPEDDSERLFKTLSISFYNKGIIPKFDTKPRIDLSLLKHEDSPRIPLISPREHTGPRTTAKNKAGLECLHYKTFQAPTRQIDIKRLTISKSNSKQGGDMHLPSERVKPKKNTVSPIDLSKLEFGSMLKSLNIQKANTTREPTSNYYSAKDLVGTRRPEILSKRRISLTKGINNLTKKNCTLLTRPDLTEKKSKELQLRDSFQYRSNNNHTEACSKESFLHEKINLTEFSIREIAQKSINSRDNVKHITKLALKSPDKKLDLRLKTIPSSNSARFLKGTDSKAYSKKVSKLEKGNKMIFGY